MQRRRCHGSQPASGSLSGSGQLIAHSTRPQRNPNRSLRIKTGALGPKCASARLGWVSRNCHDGVTRGGVGCPRNRGNNNMEPLLVSL
jgi:hypothetical protein